MAKIITVTPHTAIDRVLTVPAIRLGSAMRASASADFPSGKGVNVTRALGALNYEVVALGFLGSEDCGVFEHLGSASVRSLFARVPGRTRVNVTIHDESARTATRFSTPSDWSVKPSDVDNLSDCLKTHVNHRDVVVFSGSLPPGAPVDLFAKLIRSAKQSGAFTILDSSGEPLRAGVCERPHLLKPNISELGDLFGGVEPRDDADLLDAAKQINVLGVGLVVLSAGPRGAFFSSDAGNTQLHARVLFATTDVLDTSGVGSGDAMVAGCAGGVIDGLDLERLAKFATACASANLATFGPAQIDAASVEDLRERVELRPVGPARRGVYASEPVRL